MNKPNYTLSWFENFPDYRRLHLAAAALDLDQVKKILSNSELDIDNVEGFGQGKKSGQEPGHLYQHFCFSQRTTAVCQLFENIDNWTTDLVLKVLNLLEVNDSEQSIFTYIYHFAGVL